MSGICVVGSANLDLVAVVERVPERGETVAGQRFFTAPGGKGANQAIAAARAGGEVSFVGAVGTDSFADEVRAALVAGGVDVSLLRACAERTGTAHIVIDDSGDNSIIVVPGANATLGTLSPTELARIAAADVVLVQLEIPPSAVLAAVRAARGRVLLDPAPARELSGSLLGQVDVLLPNEHEATRITGIRDPERSLERLLRWVPAAAITLGGAGVLYGDHDTPPTRVRSPAVEVRDTTGAGDAFAGALAVALVERLAPVDAVRRAVAAASISVQRDGASPSMPTRAEIDASLPTLPPAR
jgi:ribokinase